MEIQTDLKDRGIPKRHSEGSECTCKGGEMGEAHRLLVASIDMSFIKDAERRKLAPTSETMRAKVLSQTNGHN